jgi:hypothetical protein
MMAQSVFDGDRVSQGRVLGMELAAEAAGQPCTNCTRRRSMLKPDHKNRIIEDIKASANGGSALVSVFFDRTVSIGGFEANARQIVETATDDAGRSASDVRIGMAHEIARSLTVEAPPEVFAELADAKAVTSLVLTRNSDVWPKPVSDSGTGQ